MMKRSENMCFTCLNRKSLAKIKMAAMLLVMIITATCSFGQMYSITGGTGGNAFPLGSTATNKCQFLYLPGYFPGVPAGNINKVYIMTQNAMPAGATFTNLTIRMGTTAATGFVTGAFATNLTTVYTAPTTTIPVAIPAGGWFEVSLATPFPWGMTNNLIVEISQTAYSNAFTIRYNSAIAAARHYGGVASTTGTAGAGLLNFGFDLVTTPCSGTPPPATAVANPAMPCLGSSASLSISPPGLLTGISYQWQEFDGASWINAVGGTGATAAGYVTPPVLTAKRYRVQMSCTAGTFPTTTSSEVMVSPLVTPLPYRENFESITVADQLPTCMQADLLGSAIRTYIANQGTYNRNNHTTPAGSKFASVYFSPAGTQGIYTPAFNLDAGRSYLFRFWYVAGNSGNGPPAIFNSLGAYYGTAPNVASMTNLIGTVPGNPVSNTTYQEFSEAFTPTTSGVYYIGILTAHTATAVAYLSVDDLALDSLTPCTGRPAAGTVTAPAPCAGTTFTITRTGGTPATTTGNLSYQWQDSTSTGWQNSIGPTANSNSFTTSITVPTHFRVIVRCNGSGQSDTSLSTRVDLASFLNCYCNSAAINTVDDDIGNVTLVSVPNNNVLLNNGTATSLTNNAASVNRYTNFMNTVAAPLLYRDSTYQLSMTQINSGTFFVCRAFGYIDFDHSGTFEPGELVIDRVTASTSTPAGVVRQNFTVPATAKFGPTAMRLILAEGATTALNPCSSYNWGETEDYIVNINYPPCTGTVAAGQAYASDTLLCKGYTVQLWDTTHEQQRSRVAWSWQRSSDGGLTWDTVANSSNKDTLKDVMVSGPVGYRLRMRCEATGDSSFSIPVFINIKAPYACYCYSQSNGGSTDISDIGATEIASMINSTGGPHVQNPVAIRRRTDYTAIQGITMDANGRYRLAVYHTQPNGLHANARISVFIDYNNNLQYETNAAPNSERVFTGISTESGFFIDTMITVPDAVIPNVPTGMRIIVNNDLDPNAPANLGCGPYVSGETEDYIVRFNRKPAGIAETSGFTQWAVYPNPNNGHFSVMARSGKLIGTLTLKITTVTGQTVRQLHYDRLGKSFSAEIDLNDVASGIYLLEATAANGDRQVQRLVVQ